MKNLLWKRNDSGLFDLPDAKKRISWNFVAASDVMFLFALSNNRVTNAVIRCVWNGAQQIKNAITTATK